MSQSVDQSQVINYNFYIQNNVNVNLEDLQKARKQYQQEAQTNNVFEQKERAKQKFAAEFQEKKPQPTFQERVSSLNTGFSPIATGAASPNLKSKVDQQIKTTIYETREPAFENENLTEIMGYLMVIGSGVFFTICMFAMFGSSIVEVGDHIILDFLKNDQYYSFLIPLMVPVSVVFLYFHWVSIKFFRHT